MTWGTRYFRCCMMPVLRYCSRSKSILAIAARSVGDCSIGPSALRIAAMTTHDGESLAVLISGGLDSAILLAEAARERPVVPITIRSGLVWESAEQLHLQRFLAAIAGPRLRPLVTLEQPVSDLYDTHWSTTGHDAPGSDTPDEAVYLPGRNVILLSKALVWCHLHGVPALALAVLAGNPFPDATPEFF